MSLLAIAVAMTPLQLAVEMAVANTVVAAAAALPPICSAAAYACPADSALPDARADARACRHNAHYQACGSDCSCYGQTSQTWQCTCNVHEQLMHRLPVLSGNHCWGTLEPVSGQDENADNKARCRSTYCCAHMSA